MRLIHTADWHLGRTFYKMPLIQEQSYVLDQLAAIVRDQKPDAVLIAGDLYDRAVPPPEAVGLLDETICRLLLDSCLKDVHVIMIAGNHDSPQRLGFGSRLLSSNRLHVVGTLPGQFSPVTLYDDDGPVKFYMLPFASPSTVRERLQCPGVTSHNSAMREMIRRIMEQNPSGRTVLMAHTYLAGGRLSGSDRPLQLGEAQVVDAGSFGGFQYVALGHIHRPQALGNGIIRYPGSILKYSFAEVEEKKGVELVEMDARGHCRVEHLSLLPRRDVRRITGFLREVLEAGRGDRGREDYLEIQLLDPERQLDAMTRLREVYPHTLHIQYPHLLAKRREGQRRSDLPLTDDLEMFRLFYQESTGQELTAVQEKVFLDALQELETTRQEIQV